MRRHLFALAVFALAASTAEAASNCGPHDKIRAVLGEKFNETRRSLGLAGGTVMIELYVSLKGTWTLIATDTQGTTCVIAAGEAWHDTPIIAGDPASWTK